MRNGLLAALLVAFGASAAALAAEPDPAGPFPSAWKDGQIAVPRGLPAPWVPESNPVTPEKIALGKRLFFEKAMSRDSTKSCAHCHDPALALGDGRKTALGVRDQVGPRNVPSLLNAAIYPVLFWDGRAVSLEAQAEGPLLAATELDMTEDLLVERVKAIEAYKPLFVAAFGTDTVTLRRIGYALSSFERTLLTAETPFDRWWFGKDDAAISDAAKRGYEVFRVKGGCASCHSIRPTEASFSDFEYHATSAGADGNEDAGRFAVTGKAEDKGRFRTPTLRNVALTGPWFHDGSAATLREAIDHYDKGGKAGRPKEPEIRPLHLTEEEKQDLECFLNALTSPGIGSDRKETKPGTGTGTGTGAGGQK